MFLLERADALAALIRYAREARAGDGRLVLVAGDAGVGKSALVEALRQQPEADCRWAWGLCDGLYTPRPLGPLFDLAAELGGELLELARARAPRDDLFDALLRELDRRETVLVIEDLHWADEATVDLVRFLARRLRNTLLLVTYRDLESPALRVALGRLSELRATRRIELGPLSPAAVAELAAESGLPADELYGLTGGNPFFVTEIVRAGTTAAPAQAAAARADATTAGAATRGAVNEVPPSVRDAVLARAVGLSETGRAALDLAALICGRIDPRLIGDGLDEAVGTGLITSDDLAGAGLSAGGGSNGGLSAGGGLSSGGGRAGRGGDGTGLRFRHELARRAVEQAVPAHRRAAAHATILDRLRAHDSDDDAMMAFHAEAAGDAEAAHFFSVRAATRAAELASHREAAAQYERALRFAGDLPDAVRAKLYDRLCDELTLVDRGADLADAAAHARRLWHAVGDRRREGDALRRLSEALVTLCRQREAMPLAERAREILEPFGGPELALAYAHLATLSMLTDRHDEAVTLSVRAQELAGPRLDVLSDALNTHACALAMSGQPWRDRLHQALEVALEHGHEEEAARAYRNLYGLLTCERQYDEAHQFYVDGVAFCDEHDVAAFGTCLHGEHVITLARTDRWDDATLLARRLLTEVVATPINRISPLVGLATVLVRRGGDEVEPLLDEAAATADGSAEPQWIVAARVARAEWRWLSGNPAAARREAELAADAATAGNAWLCGSVAVWLRRTGSSRLIGRPVAEPYRLLLEGDATGSAAAWTKVGSRYEAGLALLDGDDIGRLREALTIFDELGAAPAARLTRGRLRKHGVRSVPVGPRSATRAHPAGLTRREHEVLGLIVAGRTNAEIAAQLVLSVKTVDHHVSAVLGKLGAPTRSVAAAEAERRGLVTR
ncbi:AAA family ATPase [Actinoplanes sp. LDG1-06]|uniref:AAA family ATPase n=1 Tax=Paractinoplanes ovalisporus TaxID=2810368 RepID=A0ABS2AGN3_9ACTN|nr:helix-turn-helix transcriptional regulator [Actinoplanes ovalisporus]MBM2618991.1 AAA family ATPase [Actinoplanes ovalisporus]